METTFETTQPTKSTLSGIVERLVDVTLTESQYEAVLSTKQDFGKVVQYLVANYADGGILVQSSKVSELSDITGLPICSQQDICEIVENTIRRNSAAGDLRVIVDVDPAFAPALEELAQAQGRTVNEIINECVTLVCLNSWVYSLSTDGGTIPLLREQREEMESIMKCDLNSESITKWVREAAMALGQKEEKKVVQLKK